MAPPSSATFAGQVLAFNFQLDCSTRPNVRELFLIDIIGSGGCATVYRAVDLSSSGRSPRYFAVKCSTHPAHLSLPRYVGRLQAEHDLQLAASSAHPNVLPLRAARCTPEAAFFVFDLMERGTLLRAIQVRSTFWRNDRLVRAVFLQLLDAVQACHEAGVYHRDIKSENVLMSDDGENIYLADFGLATHYPISCEFQCGSLRYMSPECLNEGGLLDLFSSTTNDIWCLGITLLTLLTGRLPWLRASLSEPLYAAYIASPLTFFRAHFPVSEGAAALLTSVLDPDWKRRARLSWVRERVVEVETFFMTDEELVKAPQQVQQIAAEYAIPIPGGVDAQGCGLTDAKPRALDIVDMLLKPVVSDTGSCPAFLPARRSDSASTVETHGPVTPEVLPAEGEIDIADLLMLDDVVVNDEKKSRACACFFP